MEPGYDSSPVMVTSTISDLSGTVIGVMLKNNSESLVSAVKLGWSFSTGQAVANSLKQGETPLIAPSGTLSPGKYKELIFPIVNFAEVAAPFVRKGSLDGDYLIEVRVTEVQFEDGTIWTAK